MTALPIFVDDVIGGFKFWLKNEVFSIYINFGQFYEI